ncbi:MAG: hypothetical protein AAFO07_24810, partial [Bacteroidota bacterium]
ANGDNQGAARFTDAPGYFFDVNFGQSLIKNEKIDLKIIGMLGMYIWQTNDDVLFQNDAFLYGLGLQLESEKCLLQTDFSGFTGYKENGDRPAAINFSFEKTSTNIHPLLGVRIGLEDLLYNTFQLGVKYVMK